MFCNRRLLKSIATTLMLAFGYQLVFPTLCRGLTTGPSQPEVQGFEPVGTTDMVDMFSGSFVYNIPLMDVEGYPVNISYHGGVTMEQEASWVGLGWSLNPGVINRSVRGVPDDFNGEVLAKDFHMKGETNLRVGMGTGVELAGMGDPLLKLDFGTGIDLNVSNYKGVSCDLTTTAGISLFKCVSAGVNLGVGSQTGASVDLNATYSASSSQYVSQDMAYGGSVTVGGGYNTRSGMKDINFSASMSVKGSDGGTGVSSSSTIPIGIKNYVPVITNSSTMNTIYGRLKIGGEAVSVYVWGNISAMYNQLQYNNDASRAAYGYLYLQNSPVNDTAILDFTRDKDGMFNKSMQYLPPPTMTYDVYSVSGQGTGGVFRPFRNDFGNVFDPVTTSGSTTDGGDVELGVGDLFEAGFDYTHSETHISSGPWRSYARTSTPNGFTGPDTGSVYENVFFKQAGELTGSPPATGVTSYFTTIGGTNPMTPNQYMHLPKTKYGSASARDPRGNLIYYYTGQQMTDTITGNVNDLYIQSYPVNVFDSANPPITNLPRVNGSNYGRRGNQISEIVQQQKDGKRYVYGIPAMNNVQREATFSVDPSNANLSNGTVYYTISDASGGNSYGVDNYYSNTTTPSYAHSFLLSSILSADYVDVTGNGISDDDLGSYTKFNYSLIDSDYRWSAPAYTNFAQYNPGFWSDKRDDKGSFVCGSREEWILRSIETKNFIAEFYVSARDDAKAIPVRIPNTSWTYLSTYSASSYRLDSVRLYNKHDRFINRKSAVPIKTVLFEYDYTLCGSVPNSSSGKLTLKSIYFKYGNSQKSMISPYSFVYGNNYGYSYANKDRWGGYKPSNDSFTNYEFPYVNQNDPSNNSYASAWGLDTIKLPSGGVIAASYEANDYAFVQDRPVKEMFIVQGIGNSPAIVNDDKLYADKNSPNLYVYFKRRISSELPSLSFGDNYLNGDSCLNFNFNVSLTGAENTFEQIKGYAQPLAIGKCPNDTTYGYVKLKPINPVNSSSTLNPVSYTAINVGRYNLPQVIFPGADPGTSDLDNVLAGLQESFGELISMGQNPVVTLIDQNKAKKVKLWKSYIRLQSVGLRKKGGGQRVKQLVFSDAWTALAGGNEKTATYGKQYDYTIADPKYGTISSGVATYEPLIGGDENPMRQPVPYIVQSGNSFPPNDPVDLYQETPIGESFFPPAQVGYSQVKVSSINQSVGKSSQGVDWYQFYTAKDFPAQVIASSISSSSNNHYSLFHQENTLTATQGYTLIFNDMHGRPKKVEHDVYSPVSQSYRPISYQVYNYRQKNGKLDNYVPCIYNGANNTMTVSTMQIGVEEDVTMDSREKTEETQNQTFNSNLNFFMIGIFPCPIPLGYPWNDHVVNQFRSAAVTKIIQQYGLLENVVSSSEQAVTTVSNDIYDPLSGQVVVTSVNNEFRDNEYTTNIPAWWVYKGMAPAYYNIGYTDTGSIYVNGDKVGILNTTNTGPLDEGDELSVYYNDSAGIRHHATAWVTGYTTNYCFPVTSLGSDVRRTIINGPCTDTSTTWTIDTSNMTQAKFLALSSDSLYEVCNDSGTGCWGETIIKPSLCFSTDAALQLVYDRPSATYSDTNRFWGDNYHLHYIGDSVYLNYVHWSGPVIYGVNCTGTDLIQVKFNNVPAVGDSEMAYINSGTAFGGYVALFKNHFGFYTWAPRPTTVTKTGHVTCNSSGTFASADKKLTGSYVEYFTAQVELPKTSCAGGKTIVPRFPQNTPGWDSGRILTNVCIQVVHSGRKNMLTDNAETYTGKDYPIISNELYTCWMSDLINIKAQTFADSTTRILHRYIANGDTINPYAIGERGIWRPLNEMTYFNNRRYNTGSSRTAGLFPGGNFLVPSTGDACTKFPYYYLQPAKSPYWSVSRTISKWSPDGKEIEDIDAVGNYSTAVYGYNQELPVAVASNAKQGQVLFDGFEDYNLLDPMSTLMKCIYSPFSIFSDVPLGTTSYNTLQLSSGNFSVTSATSHTGLRSLNVGGSSGSLYSLTLPLIGSYTGVYNDYNSYFNASYLFTAANEYLPFEFTTGKTYIASCWVKQQSPLANTLDYSLPSGTGINVGSTNYPFIKKTNIIDGWQLVEVTFTVPSGAMTATIKLPGQYYIDDVRIFPSDANMKSFVYNPVNEKLMATLDENNYATLYEYDQEGNLVRVKKETTKGIMTVSESRSNNPKRK